MSSCMYVCMYDVDSNGPLHMFQERVSVYVNACMLYICMIGACVYVYTHECMSEHMYVSIYVFTYLRSGAKTCVITRNYVGISGFKLF